jgi:hypothetical protein
MVGTLISLIIALGIHFSKIGQDTIPNISIIGIILIAVATLFLFIPTLILALAWSPLQQAELNLTPKVSDHFKNDFSIRLVSIILILFPLLTYLIALDVLFLKVLSNDIVLPIWIVLLGISLDAMQYLIRRVFGYLDPFYVAQLFTHEAHKSILNNQELELCNWIDALSEIAIKAIQRTSTSLCSQVCSELQKIINIFFESSKNIAYPSQDAETKSMGIGDRVSYTLFFLLQRLEMINDKAVEQKLEPVCSNLEAVLGKIAISATKCDISMPAYVLNYMGRLSVNALQHGMPEVGSKTICILLEVAKGILTDIDITYMELQDPFNSLIAQLHAISKEMFRQNKNISVKILAQPFRELKALFTDNEKVAKHQDTPAILTSIDRILGEYDALESVMRTMPPMPKIIETEEEG